MAGTWVGVILASLASFLISVFLVGAAHLSTELHLSDLNPIAEVGAFNATEKVAILVGSQTLYEGELGPTIWWIIICAGSIVTLTLLAQRLATVGKEKDVYAQKMTYCAAAFVVGCAVRSIWPRIDVERICFWDSRISVTFVGRSFATVAEICFAAQFSMIIGHLAKEINFHKTQKVSNVFFWTICVAQCCCWMGVTTKRQLWHGIEESIWAGTAAGIAICNAVLYSHIRHTGKTSFIFERGDLGYAKRYLVFCFLFCVAYVIFMIKVDVPMYMNRYWEDQARHGGALYLWVSEGLLSNLSCDKVSKSMSDWTPEMPWMTGYFLGATCFSLWLSWGPRTTRPADVDKKTS